MKKNNVVGVAGEYFVAAELSQMDIVATLTLKNTPSIDVLAMNLENGKFANIQVKTMAVDNIKGVSFAKKKPQNREYIGYAKPLSPGNCSDAPVNWYAPDHFKRWQAFE